MNDLVSYLNNRGITDESVLDFLIEKRYKNYSVKLFSVNGEDYLLNHFLDTSDIVGYGLISTNEFLNSKNEKQTIIATVEGDDLIYLDNDNSVWIWLIESDNGSKAKVSSSFSDFVEMAFNLMPQINN